MADIQFYRLETGKGGQTQLRPAFRRHIGGSGPRALSRRYLRAVDVPGPLAGGRVTFITYDTPAARFYAPLNGEDPLSLRCDLAALAAARARPLQKPARAAPAALPGALAAGARVSTPDGCRPVETLRPGDLLTTLDGAPRPLRAMVRATHVARGGFAPVVLRPGAFGAAGPVGALAVSAQQPVLVTGARAAVFYGAAEVLVPAGNLPECARLGGAGPLDIVTYYTLLLDGQHLIRAEGVWVGSCHPADAPDLFPSSSRPQGSTDWPHIRPLPAHHPQDVPAPQTAMDEPGLEKVRG